MTDQPFKKRSILDVARERKKTLTPVPPKEQKPPVKASTVVGDESVTAKCGHIVKMPLFPDKADKFRAKRRENIQNKNCSDCRKKAHEELTKKQQEEAKARRRKKVKHGRLKDRLPDGANFNVTYDAKIQKWSGTLSIPQGPGDTLVFQDIYSAVFMLLPKLDEHYQQWLEDNRRETTTETGDKPCIEPT